MAWLVGDGFDFYNTASDAATNADVWQTMGNVFLSGPGRFGSGITLCMGNNSLTAGNASTIQFTNSQTIFVNANILTTQAHVVGGTTGYVGFTWRDTNANIQGGFWLESGGTFVITSGTVNVGGIARSPVLVPLASTWVHIEVKIFVHNTTGSVELRINGATSASWSVTGINTRNGSANLYANVVNIQGTSPSSDFFDDFYVFNDQGAAPNNFQGDVRAVQQMPFTDIAISWARNTGSNNCLAVNEGRQNGDTTYVATNTLNATDTYAVPPLSPTPTSIVAVVTKYCARMDDAGPHQVNAQLTSGGTTVNAPTMTCTSTYVFRQMTNAQDPNTGLAWTAPNLANVLLGIKDIQ